MAIRYSIIIPTLNEEKFLPKLLESLTHQTRSDFEVIVSDGASKDKTVAVANAFKTKLQHFTVVVSKTTGPSAQRNVGAAKASGEWFLFIDADSVVLPYFLDRVEAFIAADKPKHFTSWFRPDTEKVGDAITTLIGNLLVEGSLFVKRPVAPGPLTAVYADLFHEIKGYDETRTFGEDYDLTKRIADKGIPLKILRETIYIYSLRRVRAQGALPMMQAYLKSFFIIFLTKHPPRALPEYITGGHIYDKKPVKRPPLKRFQTQLAKFLKDLFE